jgi:hypothetical protein
MIPGLDSIAAKVAGGAALALAIALGVVLWRADAISAQREALRTKLATEEARHAVTRQSAATLSIEMQRLVREGEVRKERVDAAMAKVAVDTEPLREEAARIEREGLGADYPDTLRKAGL